MSTSRLVKRSIIASVVSLTGLTNVFPSAHAAIINGGFESGFDSWTTIGDTSIQSTYGGEAPKRTYQALVSTGDTAAYTSDLEIFLGLTTGSLDSVGNGETSLGSAIKQTFTANAGHVLTLKWNFLTSEATPSQFFNDFAFVTVGSLSKLADTSSEFVLSTTPFDKETGLQTFSYVVPTTGTYSLGLGAIDVGDSFNSSGLLVDSVVLSSTPVPEPNSALSLLALGVLGIGSLLKCRQHRG